MHRTGLLYLLSPFATYEGATGEDATNTFERLSTAELLHGNVLEAAIEEYDSKLVQFTEFFAETHAGRLLRDVVYDLSVYPASPIQPRVLNPRGAIIRTNARSVLKPLEGYPAASPQQGSLFLTVFVSLVCAAGVVPFCYFGAYGGMKEYSMYSLASTAGYAAGSFTLSAFYGVLPELALALVCLSVGGVAGYLTYMTSSRLQTFFSFFLSCILASHLAFSLWAGIPFQDISPAFCGPAGLLFNTGFANHYYYVLRLLYYLFLLLGAGFLYLSLPPYVKNVEPMGLEERERAKTWERHLLAFACAWVVAGAASQMIFLFGAASSPLEPLSTFYIPCQLQWSKWEAYVALSVWIGLTCLFARLRAKYEQVTSFTPHVLPREVLEQWKLMGAEA